MCAGSVPNAARHMQTPPSENPGFSERGCLPKKTERVYKRKTETGKLPQPVTVCPQKRFPMPGSGEPTHTISSKTRAAMVRARMTGLPIACAAKSRIFLL